MKRIVGVLVFLVVIVLSGYFITGLVTEHTLKKNVRALNEAHLLTVELTGYHRGLFKSNAELNWCVQSSATMIHEDEKRRIVTPPKNYVFNVPFTIYHGPFMFDHGHMRMGLGMAHGELSLPEAYVKEFQETFTSHSIQPKLMLHAFITYLNKTQLDVELPAFNLVTKDGHRHIEWLGMNSSFVFSPQHARIQGDITVNGVHSLGKKHQLILKKTTSSYDIYKADNGLYLGDAKFYVPMFQLTSKDHHSEFKLKQVDASTTSDVNDGRFASQYHLAFQAAMMNEKTYGPAVLDILTQNLDAEVLANLNRRANQLQHVGVNRTQAQQVLLSFLPDVPELLSKGAIFEISQFKMVLPEGLMNASLHIAFPETKKDSPPQLLPSIEGTGYLRVPAKFLKSLLVRSYKQKLEKASVPAESQVTEEPAETQEAMVINLDQQATNQAEQRLADLIQTGALQAKESDYVLELKLSSGRLLVNGHPFDTRMLNF